MIRALMPLCAAAPCALLLSCSPAANLGSGCSGPECIQHVVACSDAACPDADLERRVHPNAQSICQDADGDGYGPGCSRGIDCDDTDPTQHLHELCDGQDNDCDGEVDEGVESACGSCDVGCMGEAVGVGTPAPFDLDSGPSDGVELDDEGAVVLTRFGIGTHLIWIANTGDGTVSKFDTETMQELGRFVTGPSGVGNDPSRTSVNTAGDVYVGNRGGMSVTKISSAGEECPDRTGDGVVSTSRSGAERLEWGADDCVVWNTRLPDAIRAVAAQDVTTPDGAIVSFVWVSGLGQTVWKLDGETGAILLETRGPVPAYGFAFDAMGNLWMARVNELGRIDTTRCTSTATCDVEVCGDEGRDCGKQRIAAPSQTYGITVDTQNRVWLGGQGVKRYDPAAPPGLRFVTTVADRFVHGVAVDDVGYAWAAGMERGVIRIDQEVPLITTEVLGTQQSSKGIAIDLSGKIWSINQNHNNATVIEPGPGLFEAAVTPFVATTITTPYTYSDMTGGQLRLNTDAAGYHRRSFVGCDDQETQWLAVHYQTETPPNTEVVLRGRSADDPAALEMADWIDLAQSPPESGEAAADSFTGSLVEVEVSLRARPAARRVGASPRLLQLEVTHECPPRLE